MSGGKYAPLRYRRRCFESEKACGYTFHHVLASECSSLTKTGIKEKKSGQVLAQKRGRQFALHLGQPRQPNASAKRHGGHTGGRMAERGPVGGQAAGLDLVRCVWPVAGPDTNQKGHLLLRYIDI